MSIRKYLFILAGITLLSFGSVGVVLIFIPPEKGFLAFLLLYFSLLLALTGLLTFPGFWLRYKLNRVGVPLYYLRAAFRQALLFSVLVVLALMLQGERYLSMLNGLLLVVGLVFLEFFFIAKNPKHEPRR